MAAYMIFLREAPVRDAEAMAEYSKVNAKHRASYPKFEALIRYGAIEAIEGEAPDGVVVLKFDSAAAAKEWYNSPGYQEAIPFRKQGADYRAILVEGFEPPAA